MTIRIAALASGRGSNLQAVIDAIAAGALDAEIVGVFSDKPDAAALQRVPEPLRWSRKPKTFAINVVNALPRGVTAKDLILAIIGEIGVSGGTGHVLEYRGAAIEALSMDERMTICNMSIEAGARAGMIAPDATTFEYLKNTPRAPKGAGDLLTALFVARRLRGEAPAVSLEGATGAVYDVIVRSLAAESEDLLLPAAQSVLEEPVTWPQAQRLEL